MERVHPPFGASVEQAPRSPRPGKSFLRHLSYSLAALVLAGCGKSAALFEAAEIGNSNQLRALLQTGANANVRDEHQRTPLHAAVSSQMPDAVGVLLEFGADLDAQDDRGQTPLHLSASTRVPSVAKLLLKAGANINSTTATGKTPLDVAVLHGGSSIALFLLDAGGKFTDCELLPDSLPEIVETGSAVELRLKLDCCKRKGDCKIDAFQSNSHTPLGTAVLERDPDKVRILIEAGASVNVLEKDGWTPLYYAGLAKVAEIAKLLVAAGADINARDKDGYTPLMAAARGRSADVVAVLLEAGADVDAHHNDGRTALEVTIQGGFFHDEPGAEEVGALLRAHPARSGKMDPLPGFAGDFDETKALEILYGRTTNHDGGSVGVVSAMRPPSSFNLAAAYTGKVGLAVPIFSYAFVQDGIHRRIFLTATELQDGNYDCHMCAGFVGGATFIQTKGRWTVESMYPYLDELGSYGSYRPSRQPSVVLVGREQPLVVLPSLYMAQGIVSEWRGGYLSEPTGLRRVVSVLFEGENAEQEVDVTLEPVGTSTSPFDLRVVYYRTNEEGGTEVTNQSWQYDGTKYAPVSGVAALAENVGDTAASRSGSQGVGRSSVAAVENAPISGADGIRARLVQIAQQIDEVSEDDLLQIVGEVERAGLGRERRRSSEARKLNAEGLAALKNGDISGAVSALTRAYQTNSTDAEIAENLGYAEIQASSLELAETHLANSILLSPRRSSSWASYGSVLAAEGDEAVATACFAVAYSVSRSRDATTRFFTKLSTEDTNVNIRRASMAALNLFNSSVFLDVAHAAPRQVEDIPPADRSSPSEPRAVPEMSRVIVDIRPNAENPIGGLVVTVDLEIWRRLVVSEKQAIADAILQQHYAEAVRAPLDVLAGGSRVAASFLEGGSVSMRLATAETSAAR